MKKNHKTLYMILTVLLVSFLFFGSREKNVVEGLFAGLGGDVDNPLGESNKISCKDYKFSMEEGTGENGEEYGNIIADLTKQVQLLQFGKETDNNCKVVEELKDEVKKLLNELNRIGP